MASASRFTEDSDSECADCHSKIKPHVVYRREIREKLCDDFAWERQDSIKRCERNVRWFCSKHKQEEAHIFCETHQYPICNTCAVITYHAKCLQNYINDAKTEKERQLLDLVERGRAKKDDIRKLQEEITNQASEICDHLSQVKEEIHGDAESKIQKVSGVRHLLEADINREAEEKIAEASEMIRKANKKRRARLEQTRRDAYKWLKKIQDREDNLSGKLNAAEEKLTNYTSKLISDLGNVSSSIDDACKGIEKLVTKEETVLSDFCDTKMPLTRCLEMDINGKNLKCIRQEFLKISFARGGRFLLGRLDGIDEKWIIRTFSTKEVFTIIGCTSPYEVVTRSDNYISVANTRGVLSHDVFGNGRIIFTSPNTVNQISKVACLSDSKIVVSTKDGKLVVYDSSLTGELNQAMMIQTECRDLSLVTVDEDGLILAASRPGYQIYVYDPESGRLVDRISLGNRKILDLSPMSSGHIAVLSSDDSLVHHEVSVVERTGQVKNRTEMRGAVRGLAVDSSDDSIYCLVENDGHFEVDVFSATVEVIAEGTIRHKVLSPLPDPSSFPSISVFSPDTLNVSWGKTMYRCMTDRSSILNFF